ncbi:preprotein translocase subunit SecG [Bifidobacterium breve]|uniref:preprotein translocase subunit SecG n=1 Tax=Bifidobacterium breve TaxID=1685 RepID=UPI000CA22305|nr:preprotein translocase subunit SecG [Bifidobacterium breve]AUD87199.1 putative preprotein translocase subunit SecG [Bifidobacterium breve]
MSVLVIVLKAIVAVLSVLLSLLILLHRGKGGGLSDMFGGGLTANAGTSGVAERNLNRWTVGIAVVWVLLIVAIGLIGRLV